MIEISEIYELSECTIEWQDYNDVYVIMCALLGNVLFAIPISYVVWKNPQLLSQRLWSFALPFFFAALSEISTGVASFVAKDRCKLAVEVAMNGTRLIKTNGTYLVAVNATYLLATNGTNDVVAIDASYNDAIDYATEVANDVATLGGYSLIVQAIELILWLLAVVALCWRRNGTSSLPQDATLVDHQWEYLGNMGCTLLRRIIFFFLSFGCLGVVVISGNPVENEEDPFLMLLFIAALFGCIGINSYVLDVRNRYRLLRYGILDVGGFIASFVAGNYFTGIFVFFVDDIHGAWTYYQDTMVVSKSRGATSEDEGATASEDEGATASEEEGLAANEDAAAADGAKLPNV